MAAADDSKTHAQLSVVPSPTVVVGHVREEGHRDAYSVPLIEAALFRVPPFVDDTVFIHTKKDHTFQASVVMKAVKPEKQHRALQPVLAMPAGDSVVLPPLHFAACKIHCSRRKVTVVVILVAKHLDDTGNVLHFLWDDYQCLVICNNRSHSFFKANVSLSTAAVR